MVAQNDLFRCSQGAVFEVYPPNGWRHCRLTSAQRLANTAPCFCFGLFLSAALHSPLSHFLSDLTIPSRFREDPSAVISVILAAFSQLTGKFASECLCSFGFRISGRFRSVVCFNGEMRSCPIYIYIYSIYYLIH